MHASTDPHDPLAPRPDDPRIGRWWRAAGAYERDRRWGFGWPVLVGLALLLVGLAAVSVVLIAGAR
jgi:hypothetical protein